MLLLANLVVGLAGLAALGLLVRGRKSVGQQIQTVMQGQMPVFVKALSGRIEPKLDATIGQCEALAGNLAQATESNQAILESMTSKHEQYLAQFVDASEKASQEAMEAWERRSGAILTQLQARANEDLNHLFEGVRHSWQEELGHEFKKFKSQWESFVLGNQKSWRDRLDTEVTAIKQTWLAELEQQKKRWQFQLDGFMNGQPALWQERLNLSAQQAGASWNAQIDGIGAKTEAVKHNMEAAVAETNSRLTQLNQELGQAFERLKVRDDLLSALVWPQFFQDGAPLAAWRKRIEDKLAQKDPCAFGLFLALGRFNNAARDPADVRRVGEALNAVGADAYRFWKSIEVPALDAALEWRTGFQAFLEAAGIPVDIILALEHDRFDTTTMLSVDTGSATRMYVQEALSWIVRDKSVEIPKILYHARVITC
jgi:hypothetical protein